MATIVVFASSLFLTSSLVLIKAIELKYKRKNIILELISRLDSKSHRLVSNVKFMGLQFTQSARYIMLVQAKTFFKALVDKIEEKIMNEFKARQSSIMGRKEINSNGSVSFYLKKITENKGNGEKGRIEN